MANTLETELHVEEIQLTLEADTCICGLDRAYEAGIEIGFGS